MNQLRSIRLCCQSFGNRIPAKGRFTTVSAVLVFVLVHSVAAQPAGLVAAYGFNEGSGTTVVDVSGNANNGAIGTATWTASGRFGSALTFDGTNARVTVNDANSLDLTAGMTLEAWVYPTAGGGWRDVIYKGVDDVYYLMGSSDSGAPAVGDVVSGPLRGTAPLPLNTWTHLAGTYDGTTLRLYVNGVQVASRAQTGLIQTSTAALTMGGDALYGQYFAGRIDEVRIYNRALSAAEVQTDMNTPVGTPAETIPPTVAILFPANNAQLYDIVNLTADASDNVGVAGVQFLVDGVNVGAEDTASPFGLSWDTRTVANGAHVLTARARDTSGNVSISAPIAVNVANANFFQNEILSSGFALPTCIKFLPDGRMLVVELAGTIKLVPPPYTTPDATPFLGLNLNIPGYAGLQQGIFDLALDPDFEVNHYYYLFYTKDTPNRDRLSRFTVNETHDATVPGSEVILYEDPQTPNTEHHGGAVTFGNDGKIYFTTGEHFDAPNAQDLTNPRGKIHRINKDGTVPTDNPFYDGAGPNWDSIWAYGLRNPYRAFYDIPTGRLFVGDVGGNDYATAKEELNLGVAGANYGWPNSEGPTVPPSTSPIYYYPHNGRDASITGGFVYHGTEFPSSYQGNYFFADYTQNWIRRLTFDASGNVNGVFNFEPADGSVDGPYGDIVYLTEGPDGALYYVDLGYSDVGGTFGVSKIRRIRYLQSNLAPVAVGSAVPLQGPGPLTVNFSSAGSLDPEGQGLTYAWTFGDNSTSTEANPTHTYTQNGPYTARLAVSDGVNTTLANPLFISVGNPPTPTVTSPADGALFRAGDTIVFSGEASDLEDGVLPAAAFTWNVDFLHAGHVHPGLVLTGAKSGSFSIPTTGHDFSGNTRYRIMLTVADSDGLQSSQSVLVYPDKVNLSFDTVPSGRTLELDGIARATPFVYDTVIGFTHTIDAPDQSQSGTSYTFALWSDGGAGSHSIVVPTVDESYVATFSAVAAPSGLVAAYGFNEGSGTAAEDASGNGIAGIINGAVWTTGGKYGNALTFNGTSSYVDLGNPTALQLTGSMTWSAWVKAAANPADDGQIVAKSDGASGWQFKTSPDTAPHTFGVAVSGSGVGTVQRYSLTTRSLNVWYHVAGVYNAAAGTLDMYVNGVLDDGTLVGTVPAVQLNSLVNVNIGRRTGGFYFNGLIDEVRIYNRALSAAEIVSDMNTPVGATPNTAPTISDIADQSTVEDVPLAHVDFNVGDAETPVGALVVTVGSSNPALVPAGNIQLDTHTDHLSLDITPAANQNGSATITVTVSDGQSSASDTFVITVIAVNDVPTIANIADQTTAVGTATAAIGFTVGDVETAAGSLTVSGSSGNTTLVPLSGIVFGGSGANRTVTVTPAAGQTGTATITVNVSDGVASANDTFVVTVNAGNTAPTVSDIGDLTINEDGNTGAIAFTVGDGETAPGSLTVTGSSGNPTLVPDGNIVFGGSGADRTVTVTPAAGQTGSATITVTVSDGAASASDTFVLTVSAQPAGLVAAYGFNEGSGTAVADASGNANNGATGTATWTASGRYGSALTFNGTSSRVTVNDANSLDLTTGMTLEAWVYPTAGGGWRDVIYKGVDDMYYLMGSSDAGTPAVGGTFAAALRGTGNLALNAWSHLAGTYDGVTIRLYVNGVQVASRAQTGLIQTSTAALTFGGDALYGQYFAGRIDEVRIYNRALSAAEVQADMNTPVGAPPANTAPTISNIADQTTTVGTATAAIGFTVGDVETPAAGLSVTGGSGNTTLVPLSGIVFGGSGANRTVTVTPAAGQTGTATITVTVSDGTLTGSDTFVLAVSTVNTAPTISDITDRAIDEDGNTGAVAFTVGDGQTAAGSLTVTGSSGNPTLVPLSGIVFGGSGANRTVTVTPAANQSGSATINVTVSDGQLTAADTFVLTVNAVNDVPTISNIADQATAVGTATPAIGFTVGDVETAAGSLTVSGSSGNPALVPSGNIVLGGSGANRTVTVTPAAGQTGSATITVTVSDGAASASDTFVLTVSAQPAGLVAVYGFNEGSGTTVADASGNNNNGTRGTAAWTTSGKYGSALTFNGTSSRMTVADANSLDLTTGMTLEAWVYPTAGGGWRDVIYKGANDIYYLMGSSDTGRPAVGGTFATALRGTANLTLNVWTHLAGTYDGATIRLYVNGVQVASRGQTGSIQTSTAALTIGGDALYGQYFAGRIDEVRLYNRALSAAEIQADMNTPVGSSAALAVASTSNPLRITAMMAPEQGTVVLTISGGSSQAYALEATDDLVHWARIGVQESASGVAIVNEPMTSASRFYRVLEVSAPSSVSSR